MKVTYYLEVLSSWCTWVEPTWQTLKERYAGRAEFEWKIALMPPDAFPVSAQQCDWFYRRSGTVMQSPFMLNAGWHEATRAGHYDAPNLVAEAARDLGFSGDEIRLALARAAVRDGVKIGDLERAVAVAVHASAGHLETNRLREAATSGAVRDGVKIGDLERAVAVAVHASAGHLETNRLREAATSGAVRDRINASTREFSAHNIDQRPAFVLTDAIGDKAVFSGLVRIEPLAATIDAMLADTAAYASYKVHHGTPPKA